MSRNLENPDKRQLCRRFIFYLVFHAKTKSVEIYKKIQSLMQTDMLAWGGGSRKFPTLYSLLLRIPVFFLAIEYNKMAV